MPPLGRPRVRSGTLRSALSLGDAVAGNGPLAARAEAAVASFVQAFVFGTPPLYPRPPASPGGGFQLGAQQRDDVGFGQAKLPLDGVEGRPVFPGHFNDPVAVGGRKGQVGVHTRRNFAGYPVVFLCVILTLSDPSLVLLIGPSGSGKSTFARQQFRPTEIVSSDACRALVSDDENDQSVTADAFALVQLLVEKRLKHRRMTVVDATNLRPADRRPYLDAARRAGVPAVALVFDWPEAVLFGRHAQRTDRPFGTSVLAAHRRTLHAGLGELPREGYDAVHHLTDPASVEKLNIQRTPVRGTVPARTGPFDIIGDVHGCLAELQELLTLLGYLPAGPHPAGRRLVFVGDLVDRGPDSVGVLRLVIDLVERGLADCVIGNHDDKLWRKLQGRNVQLSHGLAETWAAISAEPAPFRRQLTRFLASRPTHLMLDNGALVVAHAGLPEHLQGRGESGAVRSFALYGETTGKTDEFGLPIRGDWYARYRGRAAVVFGHTPVQEARWIHDTIDIDTGCVFGGHLTALRYPERELVAVRARERYADPTRPMPVSLME
jgi:protein phosphatase